MLQRKNPDFCKSVDQSVAQSRDSKRLKPLEFKEGLPKEMAFQLSSAGRMNKRRGGTCWLSVKHDS